MSEIKVPLPYLLSAQEHFFLGGSVEKVSDPYVPVGINGLPGVPESKYDPKDIAEKRQRLGTFQSSLIGPALGLRGAVVISLANLDPENRTVEDPRILGSWDAEKEELITYSGRDLTQEYIDKYRSYGLELPIPMRETEPPRDISRK